jgi:DNA primase
LVFLVNIPQHIIEEILARIDMVELVSEHVSLRRRGQNYFGLCPFHAEKSPSFSVNPAKGIFHCFGCKAGGNAITFLIQHDNLSFTEAIEELARRTGIELPKDTARSAKDATEQELLIRANEIARDFFHHTLIDKKVPGTKPAWEFLESRSLSPQAVETYQLGYAPDEWDGFLNHALAKKIPQKILHRAGLIVPREKEPGYYDRFRSRVMFPIQNLSGKVVGFGGRTLSNEPDVPKYLNSSDTPVFSKSNLLYGIRLARPAIRQQGYALLVEGYTDALALWIAGIPQAVATLGTAFSENQARLLSRYCQEVVLTYDGDEAGLRAALRTGDIVLAQGLTPRVLLMPEGEDPDSFIRKNGAPAFLSLLNIAPPFLQFKWDLTTQNSALAPRGKSAHIRWVLESINQMPKELERSLAVKELAERTGISETTLAQELSAFRRAAPRQTSSESVASAEILSVSSEDAAALELLKIIILHPALSGKVFPNWDPEQITSVPVKCLAKTLKQRHAEKSEIIQTEIMCLTDDASLCNWIAQVLVLPELEEPERAAHDCLIRLKCLEKESGIADLLQKVKAAEAGNDDPRIYLLQIHQLRKEITDLKHQRLWEIRT